MTGAQDSAKPLRILVGYFHPWTNEAGLYVASAAGHYRAEGLDVAIGAIDPLRGDGLAHLVREEVDFAVVPSSRLLVRRELGERLIGVAAINHRAMEAIQTNKSTGIDRPRALAGKRLALNPTPRGVAMVRHLVRVDGGDPDAVELVDSGVRELSADDIAAGEVDATFGGYWAWDLLFEARAADQRVFWPVDEIGAPAYHSYVLATREALVLERADLVRSVLAATARGYQEAAADPDGTLEVLERVIAYFPRQVLRRSLELIAPTWTDQRRWGIQREELFAGYAAWLAENGILADPDGWRAAIENDLLPA